MAFEVLPTDIYGTGKFDDGAGLIMPEGKWKFEGLWPDERR
jgi:hypothetical protein